jgi:RNA polymerase sigma factor (sigma-70 family)
VVRIADVAAEPSGEDESNAVSSTASSDPTLPWRERTDINLVDEMVLGSADAYAEIYRRHHTSVFAVTRMILGNGPSCEDVVDEVFVGLWLFPGKFDPKRCSLLGYLRMVAKNRSIDALRAETRRKSREVDDFEYFKKPVANIDATMLESETASALQSALAGLPCAEREAIVLAYFGEMSYSAVALHLEVAEGTVKSRIRAGLRRLSEDYVVQLQFIDRRRTDERTPFHVPGILNVPGDRECT